MVVLLDKSGTALSDSVVGTNTTYGANYSTDGGAHLWTSFYTSAGSSQRFGQSLSAGQDLTKDFHGIMHIRSPTNLINAHANSIGFLGFFEAWLYADVLGVSVDRTGALRARIDSQHGIYHKDEDMGYSLSDNTWYTLILSYNGTSKKLTVYVYDDAGTTLLASYEITAVVDTEINIAVLGANNKNINPDANCWYGTPADWSQLPTTTWLCDSLYAEEGEWFPPAPPVVQTDPASAITSTQATLNATVIDDSGEDCEVWLEYGLDTGYGTETNHETQKRIPDTIAENITSLDPDTTYHFRAVIMNSQGTTYGADGEFDTPPLPAIDTDAATDIGYFGATVNSEVTEDSAEDCEVWFNYGKTVGYGSSTSHQTGKRVGNTPFAALTGLDPDTTYHYQAAISNNQGATTGSDMTFKTDEQPCPTIETQAATDVGDTYATISAEVTEDSGEDCEVYFQYGKTLSYGSETTHRTGKRVGNVISETITGLDDLTVYHFRAVITNTVEDPYGDDLTFETELTPPTEVDDRIFKGNVLTTKITPKSVQFACYDVLQALNNEHIPPNEGKYAGTDAGAIIKDIISNSGHDIDSGGIDIETGVIVDSIDLTDKSRLEAIKLLLYLVIGGNDDGTIYHIYVKNDSVIFAPLPDYENQEPAVTLTDAEITDLSVEIDGSYYFDCATVVGANGVRAYYPGKLDPENNPIPDFPDNPRHKNISDTSLIGVDACYQVARGWVRAHNEIPKKITVKFVPDRFDYFPGQTVEIDSARYNAYGNFILRELAWTYERKKTMAFTLSSVEVLKPTTYIKP
ncbi:hypothetical protein [Sulfuricurvum sp.]|uniref:hypothetical protein n=1 Tax=Sulfuricurvum sp. TaxID=2025608 RepID=UPI0035676E1B